MAGVEFGTSCHGDGRPRTGVIAAGGTQVACAHADGLTIAEAGALLRSLLADPRIRIVEVAEYASLATPIGARSVT